VAAPSNSQNDRVYVPLAARKRHVSAERLLRTRPTFTQSVMVSVAVSALGRTSIHLVYPGVKINGKYYREVLLTRHLLPEIRQYSKYFIFQQDGAPAHAYTHTMAALAFDDWGAVGWQARYVAGLQVRAVANRELTFLRLIGCSGLMPVYEMVIIISCQLL